MSNVLQISSVRMENSESSSSPGPLLVAVAAPPDRAGSSPPAQLPESSGRHRERLSKSPRRRRRGPPARPQPRGGVGQEQLLREAERRRFPGQHEHSEPSASASDTAESSPKRFALQATSCSAVPPAPLRCPGQCPHASFYLLTPPTPTHPTGEPTSYMDRTQPLTLDPKPAFFPTRLQSCKNLNAE